MATIQDTVAYLLQNYPHQADLSNARVTKMVYLADWHQAMNYGKQVTPINWYFDNYGPFVWDIKQTAQDNPDLFRVDEISNFFKTAKILLSLKVRDYQPKLAPEEKISLDHVISATKHLTWDAFLRVVYGTHPILSSERYAKLDLVAKAQEYKAISDN